METKPQLSQLLSSKVSGHEVSNQSTQYEKQNPETEELKRSYIQRGNNHDISQSKIWSQITSNRIKQAKQVIQIIEQKPAPELSRHNQPTQSNHKIMVNQVEQTQGPNIEHGQNQFRQHLSKSKQEYWNREIHFSHIPFLTYKNESQQLAIINQNKMKQLTIDSDETKNNYRNFQTEALKTLIQKSQSKNINVIRCIDLMYKKFILKPIKDSQSKQNTYQQFDIYKPDPIINQRYYSLQDRSLNFQKSLSNSRLSQINSFKRSAPVKVYQDNYVSLLENQSTNQNGDYLQSIAHNYINGIRKQKFQDLPSHSMPQNHPPLMNSHKFKKQNGTQMSLPFDIQISQQSARRESNPRYDVFQSADDVKNQRFEQQRLIAKTFVKDGYGLNIIRNYKEKVDGGAYNRAITTIIRESYKKIQDYLIKKCNFKIHSLTSSEFSLVKTPLVHCRNIFNPQNLRTFFKYIALTYKFGKLKESDYPNADETFSLYNAIYRGLNDRKAAKQHKNKPNRDRDRDMYFG